MKRTERQEDCRQWMEFLEEDLIDMASPGPQARTHLRSCRSCRDAWDRLQQADSALVEAFRALDVGLPGPSDSGLQRILESAQAPPEAVFLRRLRRPINTMLWLSVLLISLAALAALAWCGFWLARHD